MPRDIRSIALSRIDAEDVTYRISTERDDRLSESIRSIGQLHPIRLMDCGGPLIILSGFRRIAACRLLGHTEIIARVTPERDLSDRCRCLLAIGDNSTQRSLNPVEMARSVKLLRDRITDPGVVRECLNALMLPDNPAWLDMQLALAALPPDIQQLLQRSVVGTAMALELGTLEPADGETLGRLFADLRLSLSRQREVLGICRDLSRRDGQTIGQILEGPELRGLLDNADTDIGAKTHGLRRQLKRMRYPGLVAAEAEFNKCLKLLTLGQGIRLDAPPFFEGTAYTMTLSFTSIEALNRQLEELKEKVSSRHLSRILDRSAD
ncbi:MAG: ParB/RepB/Spo0J family partition protein [Pseudomonadota bacterium]